MNVCALVLARGGSKSIHNKNLQKLNGIPLISYALIPAQNCICTQRKLNIPQISFYAVFSQIWVSTDDDQIEQTVRNLHPNVNVFRRSRETSTDECSSLDSIKEFLSFKKASQYFITTDVDIICLIQATSPCLHKKYLQQAYEMMVGNKRDSVFSVTRDHKLRWLPYNHLMKAINFNPRSRPRRQDWSGELIESGHFYWATRKLIDDHNLLQNELNSDVVEIPPQMCLEIDDKWQIPLAELILKNHGYVLSDELKSKL
ncbi:N-acylneuraminate cytidylyltransferase-like isoform X1 [Leptotrombidium deliense]|uniref:N-acylneuraminate cytidylyltransferase-like isoform X1 n=1 Tax=Leptotrombidium deliense TaxID=299467 RepID=A0A443SDF7_9ACAR|nr:N-acylneuraminate cytidylyltransferase-like isoform X1 [Leptotrombidium deliense]